MARYDGIWKQLKETNHCAITAPTQLHRRIIRGVIKAKDEDNLFKLHCLDIYQRKILSYKCEGNRIRFFLTKYYRLDLVSTTTLGDSSEQN